jgi:hypothetical protein
MTILIHIITLSQILLSHIKTVQRSQQRKGNENCNSNAEWLIKILGPTVKQKRLEIALNRVMIAEKKVKIAEYPQAISPANTPKIMQTKIIYKLSIESKIEVQR